MFDCSVEFKAFYNDHVRLGVDRRSRLAKDRDTNLERIKNGLKDLQEESGKPRPSFSEYKNQGGYAMHTLNQAENNEYDIDVALIFRKEDLPAVPSEARLRIRDALRKRATNFVTDPEARTNAVTVWYEDGYHLDFAIYRTSTTIFGTTLIEHAGGDRWLDRDPMEVNKWFSSQVESKSPKKTPFSSVAVDSEQLRRIVRYVKRFSRSRKGWSLPGGMIISTLVSEVYIADTSRDDVSLRSTLRSLRNRLRSNKTVNNPVRAGQILTQSEKHQKQVSRLSSKLDQFVPKLDVLDEESCTSSSARAAWNYIFNHKSWKSMQESTVAQDSVTKSDGLFISCGLAKYEKGPIYKQYPSGAFNLVKGLALRFSIVGPLAVKPDLIRWTAHNEGDEASEAGQLTWTKYGDMCWTSSQYRGTQTMTVELLKNGSVAATATHVVKIL